MPDLTGRTAIVTGGATLIGRGVVGALADVVGGWHDDASRFWRCDADRFHGD